MKKLLIFIFSGFMFLVFFIKPAQAEFKTASEIVETTVGTVAVSSSMLKAAQDIKKAYDACGGSFTFDPPSLGPCLGESLSRAGYSEAAIRAFESRRKPGTLVSHTTISPWRTGTCTECLGFVALSLTLVYQQPGIFGPPTTTSSIHGSRSFTVGGITYSSVRDPLPGDLASTDGHIAIVQKVDQPVTFYGIESNWGLDCKMREAVPHLIRSVLDPWVFFRKRPS